MKNLRAIFLSGMLATAGGTLLAQSQSSGGPNALVFSGTAVTAIVSGTTYTMPVLQNNETERLMVPLGATVCIQVSVPPNANVHVVAHDGGGLESGATFEKVQADGNGLVSFLYALDNITGTHRLALHCHGDQRILNFWAGEPLAPRVSGSTEN